MTTEELIAARRAEPWREALRKSKKNKERTDIPRVEMNELDAEYRSHTPGCPGPAGCRLLSIRPGCTPMPCG